MAQEPSTPNENPQAEEQAPAAAAKTSLFGKIKILLFVALVIAVECVVAYLYLPKTAETAALAGSAVENKEENKTKAKQDAENEQNRQLEVDLGEFNVTAYQPASNTTLRIDFHLYGTVCRQRSERFYDPPGRKPASLPRTSTRNGPQFRDYGFDRRGFGIGET